jgi:hypothetical protein
VRRLIELRIATIQFYPAELIGDTAAPPSSTAIVTFFDGPDSLVSDFAKQISTQTFQLPLKDAWVQPQVEYAPVQILPPEGQPMQKQLALIDEDPEFRQFAKDYGTSHIPATDSLLSHEEIVEDTAIDSANVVQTLNDRLSGRGERTGQGGKKGGKRNRGKRGG